ncbi:DUF4139 domain-containing protein [Ruminococcaceae bacterium OttesenSCG-928-N02]|nr:DUF4139 domain-containing protein [Ruminococcaceae bacterium OttesenSCG-928-N02]
MSQSIQSEIREVTVYLSGAQVTRHAQVSIKGGNAQLLLEHLPHTLQPQSVQVGAVGANILSVEHRLNHLQGVSEPEKTALMQSELEEQENLLAQQQSLLDLCALEVDFLARNSTLAGNETGLPASELKEALLFYSEHMESVRVRRIACEEQMKTLQERIDVLRAQLGAYQHSRPTPTSEILITLAPEGEGESQVQLTLSYYVPAASWQPLYDIRARNTQGPVLLHCKAKVSQHTGEDWTDVKLNLSTGNPSVGGACPEMHPWFIDFQQTAVARSAFNAAPRANFAQEAMMDDEKCKLMKMQEPDEMFVEMLDAEPAVVKEAVASMEYAIKERYSVASGDEGQTVDIITHSLAARYHHFSARKLEKEVFLLAAVKEWSHLGLVAGKASIFFEDQYVGATFIDPRRTEEELSLSLGADRGVVVTRVRGKDYTEKTLTGTGIRQTRQWELTVRNLKKTEVTLKLQDQIPVSQNKQITVDAAEISGAQLDKDTGILTWELELAPGQVQKFAVKYTVTHPKNTAVVLE